MSFEQVEKALSEGVQPALLCMTCPWDRNCISPPVMTKAEFDQKMSEAKIENEQNHKQAMREGKPGRLPMATVLTSLTFGGEHNKARVCPVLVVRLRSSGGREIVDELKSTMRDWLEE